MPKHYCDYCDVFLTHDSASVRKAHNSGRNHLANVRDYYASLGHDKAQNIIDQITSAYESGGGPPPGGFGFGPQHLGGPAPPSFGGPPMGFGGPPGFREYLQAL
ncbi:U1 zinc finger-domain-containing protein [Mucidula mucida]|nr:U1 zinc finger-domain-containing protein [Mucidula mucida]